jgi:MFS family permease
LTAIHAASIPWEGRPVSDLIARKWAFVPVLMTGTIGQSLLFSIIIPALPGMAEGRANGAIVAQFAMALPSLGLIVAGFFAGPLIERFGPRNAIIGALASYALLGSLPWIWNASLPLLGSRLLLGMSCGIITTTATLLLVARYEDEARGRMIGYQVSAGSAGGMVGLIGAGAVVSGFGWAPTFLLYGLIMALFLLFALIGVPAIRPAPATEQATGGLGAVLKRLWPIYLFSCLIFVVPVGSGAQLPFLLNANGITSPVTQSLVIAMTTVGSMATGLFFGRIQALLGARLCFALSLTVGAAGFLLFAFAGSVVTMGLGSLLSGIGVGLYMPHLWLATSVLAPDHLRSRALGLLSTAMFLGGFLYPAIYTPLTRALGLTGPFLVIGTILLLGGALAAVLRRGRLLMA